MTNSNDRQTMLKQLAKLSEEELMAKSKQMLKRYCHDIGIKTIYRNNGDTRKISIGNLTKSEIVKLLMAETEAHRKSLFINIDMDLVKGLTDAYTEGYEDLNKDFAESLIAQYVDILNQHYDPIEDVYKAHGSQLALLANTIYTRICQRYGSASTANANTRLWNRSDIFNKVKNGLKVTIGRTQHKNQLEIDLNTLDGYLKLLFKEDALAKQKQSEERVNIGSKNRSAININQVLDKARDVIANPETSNFYDLIIAMVMVTGRRPFSEVCMEETSFVAVDDHTVEFTGQAKVKGRTAEHYLENPSYNIPVLAPVDTVIKAWDYLKKSGRLVQRRDNEDDQTMRRRGNKKFSKEVSKRVKDYWLNLITWVQASEQPHAVTPHTFREFYALQACIDFAGVHNYDVAYAAQILGHDENDKTTAQRYQMDFVLVGTTK